MVLIPETLLCIFLDYKIWLFTTAVLSVKLYYRLVRGVCKSPKCLVGKTVLITGANAGIGFETALDIASRGAKVIIACRDKQRGQQACDDIIARSGNPNVSLQILDLASFDSVRQCAKNIHATEKKIDILINNAGVTLMKRVTEDGLNITMQVNYCSTFLFTVLLIGIGYNIALLLASRGCRVIIADINDSEIPKNRIISETNNPDIIVKKLNLASLNDVRTFAEELKKTETSLDILICNAGIGSSQKITEDGFHEVMQVNYLGHLLLTHLLVDLLKESSHGRVVFTSSALAFINNLNRYTLKTTNVSKSISDIMKIYANSKMANIIAAQVLAHKLKPFNISCNSVNPGSVSTSIFSKTIDGLKYEYFYIAMDYLFKLIAGKSPYIGAQTSFHLATSKKIGNTSGRYFQDCNETFKPFLAYKRNKVMKIWDESIQLINLKESEML